MKRHLLILAIFLLLGAVVNAAVAWGCAVWASPAPTVQYLHLANGSQWPRRAPDAWPLPTFGGTSQSFGSTVTQTGAYTGQVVYGQSLFQFGLPCRVLELQQDRVQRAHDTARITWISAAGPAPAAMRPRNRATRFRIPLRPLWTGFVVNTIFYAAILWLLICGPFVLRRFLRVRRGLCPKCAYPMGESAVCSECGGAVLPNRPLRGYGFSGR